MTTPENDSSEILIQTLTGLANGLTGLYQINVVVPQLPANNAEPITLTLGTTAGSLTLYLAVQAVQ